jgi:hypothetical protein
LKGKRIVKVWTTADLKIIRDNWRTQTDDELAVALGVSYKALQAQRLLIGINRPPNCSGLVRANMAPKKPSPKKGKPFTSTRKGRKMRMISVFYPDGTKKTMTYGKYLWIRENGPLSEGKELMFLDGNALNTKMSNLAPMTRSEGARYTQLRRSTEERRAAAARMVAKQKKAKMLRLYLEHKPYEFKREAA